MLRKQKAC